LKSAIELADGLLFIDALITLEPFDDGITGYCDRLSERRFPASRRPFDNDRLLHPRGEIDHLKRNWIDHVLRCFHTIVVIVNTV